MKASLHETFQCCGVKLLNRVLASGKALNKVLKVVNKLLICEGFVSHL